MPYDIAKIKNNVVVNNDGVKRFGANAMTHPTLFLPGGALPVSGVPLHLPRGGLHARCYRSGEPRVSYALHRLLLAPLAFDAHVFVLSDTSVAVGGVGIRQFSSARKFALMF